MADKYIRSKVTVRTISGHPTGIALPQGAQARNRSIENNPGNRTSNVLASAQPNTDRRRYIVKA
jgi:hypothetical protein